MCIKRVNILLSLMFLAINIKAADERITIDLTDYCELVDAQNEACKLLAEKMKREDLTDLTFWEKLSYEKNLERFEELERKKNAIQAIIDKNPSAMPVELLTLMTNLKGYSKDLQRNDVKLAMRDFKSELSHFEEAVQKEVAKLDASLTYMTAIAERADNQSWAHALIKKEICQQCKKPGTKVSFCMGCELQCCNLCENTLALPEKLRNQDSRTLLCNGCVKIYSMNTRLYEGNIFSVKAKRLQLDQQKTLEIAKQVQQALLLRNELLKNIEIISNDLLSFSKEYVAAADKLERSIRARLALMNILYAAGTSKDSIIPALGAVAGKALLKISDSSFLIMAGKSLPFLGIALLNGYSAYHDTEKIGKYCLIAGCQIGLCLATGGCSAVVTAIAVWAAGALADAGYEIYLINDEMAWKAIVSQADQCAEISKNAAKEFCVLF